MEYLQISKYIFAALLILAGILHFVKPRFYLKIMPDYLPAPKFLVLISGIAEVLCGLLLLFPKTQNIGVWLTVALLIAVFPANIEMARKYYVQGRRGRWLTILRLPLQILLIWYVLKFLR